MRYAIAHLECTLLRQDALPQVKSGLNMPYVCLVLFILLSQPPPFLLKNHFSSLPAIEESGSEDQVCGNISWRQFTIKALYLSIPMDAFIFSQSRSMLQSLCLFSCIPRSELTLIQQCLIYTTEIKSFLVISWVGEPYCEGLALSFSYNHLC